MCDTKATLAERALRSMKEVIYSYMKDYECK